MAKTSNRSETWSEAQIFVLGGFSLVTFFLRQKESNKNLAAKRKKQ